MTHRWKRKSLSLLLAAALLATTIPFAPFAGLTAQAEETENTETVTIEAGEQTLSDRTINGKEGSAAVIVRDGATLTLRNVTITGAKGQSAVYIEKNATLIIEGTVNVTGGDADFAVNSGNIYVSVGGGAGIEVPEGSSLNLKGSGVLNATGGNAGNGLDGGTTPNGFSNSVGGAGGGGAGAGIGGKGGTHDLKPHAGSITIDDKSLLVYANGGKGGQGGAGADGGDARRVGEVKQSNGFYMLASYNDAEVVYEGGAGGGGGGGGGYPAAGIGSGGAAGKRGAAGGQGGRDDAYAIIVITALVVYIPETWCAAGGGGGAGGLGYVSGGGGGAGAASIGQLSVTSTGSVRFKTPSAEDQEKLKGYGGGPGADGTDPRFLQYTYEGKTATTAKSGKSGLLGGSGQAGTATDRLRQAADGVQDSLVPNLSGRGADVTISGGLVFAACGGENKSSGGFSAQNVGAGGSALSSFGSGSLKILGGSLHTKDNIVTPTNAAGEQLYPVTIYPSETNSGDQNKRPTVIVDGDDWDISRFGNDNCEIILWLPDSPTDEEGIVPYEVAIDQPTPTAYNVTVIDGKATLTTSQKTYLFCDMWSHRLTINENRYTLEKVERNDIKGKDVFYIVKQGRIDENTQVVLTWVDRSDEIWFVEARPYEKGWVYVESVGDYEYSITLDGCRLFDLSVSDAYDGGENNVHVKVNAVGEESRIDTLTVMDPASQVTFEGEADSKLSIGSLSGAEWPDFWVESVQNKVTLQYEPVTRWPTEAVHSVRGSYLGDLILTAGYDTNGAKKLLNDQGISYDQFFPINLNIDTPYKYMYLAVKIPETPWEANSYETETDYPAAQSGKIYDIMQIVFDEATPPPEVYETDYGKYRPVNNIERGNPEGDLCPDMPPDIYIYVLHEEDVNWENWNKREEQGYSTNPITNIQFFRGRNSAYCTDCFCEWAKSRYIDKNGNIKDEDTFNWQEVYGRSTYLYLAIGRNYGCSDTSNGQPYTEVFPMRHITAAPW